MRHAAVVALGGGHGLHASLSALRHLVDDLTAVVTVADDGGSSGRLRHEFGVLPPGDLRMALAALCGDDEWGQTWAEVLQHRFAGDGEMRGHVVGNLLIVSLWEQLGDHVAALDWVGRLLGAAGRVLPMALTPLVMTAQIRGADPSSPEAVTTVRGQVEVATSGGTIESVALEPAEPVPCAEACLIVTAGHRPARSDDKKKEVKKAERIECVLVALNETYELQTKNQKAYMSFLVEESDSMDVGLHPADGTKLLLTPKKEGVYGLIIDFPGGAKEKVTVVVLKKAKK
jgi:hypothetical protein